MSGLCGWIRGAGGPPADPRACDAMLPAITRFDRTTPHAIQSGEWATAVAGTHASVLEDEGRLFAVWGPARFTRQDLALLAERHGRARALAQAYSLCGSDVVATLGGCFAIAILDGRRRTAMLAVDRMGTHPLYYSVVSGALVFGSTLDAVVAFPGCAAAVDSQAVFDYVHFHVVPGPGTIYEGCYRLQPGSLLQWTGGEPDVRPYWKMRYVEDVRSERSQLREDLLAALRSSVHDAAQDGSVGAFLSGGTDSSTIAGILGEVTGEPARTYSIGFESEGYDEMEYARIAARHFGTRHHEYYVTPVDVAVAIPLIADVFDQPFGNSSVIPTYYCAKLAAEDGVRTMLGGDGGDELFGGNERYAKQHLYSLYGDLPEGVRRRLIEPIAFLFPEKSVVGKVQRYMRNASEAMPARYDNYNLLERFGARNVFSGEFLRAVDVDGPRRMFSEAYQDTEARSLINRMLALDLRFTLADNDLPKVARACELAGVGARFPLLDDRVVSFSAALAPRLKLRGTRLRYFFKESLRGFLPPAIISKQKHGFGLPFGPWLRTDEQLRQLALDSLVDLRKRRIVQTAFLDELTSTYVDSHAAYYGTMVWILMILELWFRRRGRDRRGDERLENVRRPSIGGS